MDREIAISGWSEQWLNRTLPSLHCYTMLVIYAITLTSLFIGIRALIRVRRCRKELHADPSSRVATMAKHDKLLHKSLKTIFYFAHIYLAHALIIWLVDAVLSISYLFEDVNDNPDAYNASVWLNLAIQSVSTLAVFAAVFIIFPLVQIMGVAHLVKRNVPKNSDGTLSAYISEGRIVTTHLAQLWLMVGFCVVAWWPVLEMALPRLIVLEAVFGSGLAWLHASFAFNFRSQALCKVTIHRPASVSDHVKLYGQHVVAVYNEKSQLLPKHEETAHDQKTGL